MSTNPAADPRLMFSPNWPAPNNVKAYSTLCGSPDNPFNLADHVDDPPERVQHNRLYLQQTLQLPQPPYWLQQQHSAQVISLDTAPTSRQADSSIATTPCHVCVVVTADCLPILLCNTAGSAVAAIHVGWRGLLAGVISQTLQQLNHRSSSWLAWLGPCIGPSAFRVNTDIKAAFMAKKTSWHNGFSQNKDGDIHADLQQLAITELHEHKVTHIYQDPRCTFLNPDQFFSYRRDGGNTGRMAHLIWLAQPE